MTESSVRQLPDVAEPGEGRRPLLLVWLTSGLAAGLLSGIVTAMVAIGASAGAGLPWYRPINVIASLAYGPHLAVADGLRSSWLNTAATFSVPLVLAAGLVYGVALASLGFRPTVWLSLKLGLIVGLSAWLIVVKGIAPLVSPLTVRLVPIWVTLGLFGLFGLGLAMALPVALLLSRRRATPPAAAHAFTRASSDARPR